MSKKQIIIIVGTFIVGLGIGNLFTGGSSQGEPQAHDRQESEKTQIWTCSMHPQIRQNEPGQCPICGMDLIPLSTGETTENTAPNEVQMTKIAMKLADVQTYIVKKEVPQKDLRLQGKVQPDERKIMVMTARFPGRIEKLYINYTGQKVYKNQKLASIYSPELNTAQQELLDALQLKETNPSFYKATRKKLKLWQLTDSQIDAIEQGGKPKLYIDILSPATGTVLRRDIAVGDYVKEGSPLFQVVDLRKVWILFDAYERDLPWIQKGDAVSFSLASLPGKTYDAKVTHIDPFINPKTRVAQVRVEINNPKGAFKPEMFVNGILHSDAAKKTNQLLIPKTAILWTGKRAIVYVKVPNRQTPSFVYRNITLGTEAGNYYVVVQGLREGEEIASNGVFKIDASAQLLGKASMMNPEGGKPATGHNHGDKTMTEEEMKHMDVKNTQKSKPKIQSKPDSKPAMKCGAGKCGADMKEN